MKYIDLRSDTVTRPSPGMMDAMMRAEVGDDVYGEDPTVNKLQDIIAEMFGKPAALFVPSGTMGNEICIKAHTQPGDEIILDGDSHIFVYETAGPALLAGVQMMPVSCHRGLILPAQIREAIRKKIYYLPRTRLICLENTHGRSAGSVLPIDYIQEISGIARDEGILMHLDGARLWNASVAAGVPVRDYARYFDSVSVCFSKGLGAPIGSIIIGGHDFIENARKYRKIFGGGMRQAGFLAAAALYAVNNNIRCLANDHEKAKYFASELSKCSLLSVDLEEVQTNMVMIEISRAAKSQTEILELLKHNGLLLTPERKTTVRAVMHLDVSMEEIKTSAGIFRSLFG